MKHFKILDIVAFIALGFTIVLLGIYLYWLSASLTPVLTGTTVIVKTKEVKQGGIIEITSDICKNIEVDTVLIRTFQDDLVYNLPPLPSNAPVGCLDTVFAVPIPDNLPPDTYSYTVEFVYMRNPVVTQRYKFESNQFKVME